MSSGLMCNGIVYKYYKINIYIKLFKAEIEENHPFRETNSDRLRTRMCERMSGNYENGRTVSVRCCVGLEELVGRYRHTL